MLLPSMRTGQIKSLRNKSQFVSEKRGSLNGAERAAI